MLNRRHLLAASATSLLAAGLVFPFAAMEVAGGRVAAPGGRDRDRVPLAGRLVDRIADEDHARDRYPLVHRAEGMAESRHRDRRDRDRIRTVIRSRAGPVVRMGPVPTRQYRRGAAGHGRSGSAVDPAPVGRIAGPVRRQDRPGMAPADRGVACASLCVVVERRDSPGRSAPAYAQRSTTDRSPSPTIVSAVSLVFRPRDGRTSVVESFQNPDWTAARYAARPSP